MGKVECLPWKHEGLNRSCIPWGSHKKARCDNACWESLGWGGRDGRIPGACWPVSQPPSVNSKHCSLLNCRQPQTLRNRPCLQTTTTKHKVESECRRALPSTCTCTHAHNYTPLHTQLHTHTEQDSSNRKMKVRKTMVEIKPVILPTPCLSPCQISTILGIPQTQNQLLCPFST